MEETPDINPLAAPAPDDDRGALEHARTTSQNIEATLADSYDLDRRIARRLIAAARYRLARYANQQRRP